MESRVRFFFKKYYQGTLMAWPEERLCLIHLRSFPDYSKCHPRTILILRRSLTVDLPTIFYSIIDPYEICLLEGVSKN